MTPASTSSAPEGESIDWSLTTWEGSRRAQLRRWCSLTIRERFQALQEMIDLAERLAQMRKQGRLK